MVESPSQGSSPLMWDGHVIDRAFLHRFALAARTLTLSMLENSNTCIFTSRVAVEALQRMGVSARVMPVFVGVHNREGWALAEQGVPPEQWPTTAWSVGISETTALRSPGGGWNGHLVIIVRLPGDTEAPRLLVDLTADQFDRPIRNLVVGGPVFMGIRAGANWSPQDPLFTLIGGRDDPDLVMSYRPMPPGLPETTRWRQTPDWNLAPGVADRFFEALVQHLAGSPDAPV